MHTRGTFGEFDVLWLAVTEALTLGNTGPAVQKASLQGLAQAPSSCACALCPCAAALVRYSDALCAPMFFLFLYLFMNV